MKTEGNSRVFGYRQYEEGEEKDPLIPLERDLPYELIGLLGGAMNSELGMVVTQLMVDQDAETVDDIREFLGWPGYGESDPYKTNHYEAISRAYERLVSSQLATKTHQGHSFQGNKYQPTSLGRNLGIIFAGRGLDFHSKYPITARGLYGSSQIGSPQIQRYPAYIDTPYGSVLYQPDQAEIRVRFIHQLAIAHKNNRLPMRVSGFTGMPLSSVSSMRDHLGYLQDLNLVELSVLNPSEGYTFYDVADVSKWPENPPTHSPERFSLSREGYTYILVSLLEKDKPILSDRRAAGFVRLHSREMLYVGDERHLRRSMGRVLKHFASQGMLVPHPLLENRESIVDLNAPQAGRVNELVNNLRLLETGDYDARRIGAVVLNDPKRKKIIVDKIENSVLASSRKNNTRVIVNLDGNVKRQS